MRKLYLDPQLQLVFGITLMVVLGVSTVFPVIPDIMRAFDRGPAEVGLIITVFTLPGIVLAPLAGILADRYGRRAVLLPSLLVFGIFGGLCALAPGFYSLLALRFVQGLGAAALGVLATTLIGDLYRGRDLASAMGYNAAVLSIGTASYPALGGLLGMLGWRAPFLLHLSALPLAWLVARKLQVRPVERNEPFLTYIRSACRHMSTAATLGLFATTFATFILLYGPVITFYPILLDQRFDALPVTIGLIISSASLFAGSIASQLGRITAVIPEAWLIRAGCLLYAACFALTPFLDNKWLLLLPMALFGLAQGLTLPSMTTVLNRMAPSRYRAGFMAVYGTLLRLGQTVGPLLAGGMNAWLGMDSVFLAASLLALTMFATMLTFVRPSACAAENSAG